ncbi:hypothetical protein CRUP_017453, partial [Coryphaenoides rupestris]
MMMMMMCCQDDEDLVPEFVVSEGLTCFIKVGAEADHNYQNYILRGTPNPNYILRGTPNPNYILRGTPKPKYILRALSQIMLFVDGMNGVIGHNETVQWLYTLTGSLSRLVVKTALKLLIVFVEYSEFNSPLLITAVNTVDHKRAPSRTSSRLWLYRQLPVEPAALRYEDGDVDDLSPQLRKERRKMAAEQEGRRSRRSSAQNLPDLLSSSPDTSSTDRSSPVGP